ncbi:T9SS type A sorting domain-containing protein [Winogradskyella vidalii]|uniref:T9SS type A sorting domain-containing protein n=1 Tax=Winogradskyella vidalii TaxID=2615024 RepID=UPI0015C82D04|nr:T9SS type A sorting domain-containing protein [Winogradskyella vidalii]
MKTKLFLTLLLTSCLTFGQELYQLPLYEGFDYAVAYSDDTPPEPLNTLLYSDTMIGLGPWIEDNYSSTKNPFLITSPFTSYAGLPAFTGNAIEIKGGTNDPLLYFEPVNENDGVNLYASCMVKVTDMSSVSGSLDYFFALATSGFGYGAALYFSKVDDTTYNLGINESNTSGEAIVYTGATFTENVDEVFVVIKYEFNSSGNSVAHLFVNPVINGATEPASHEDTSSISLEDEANRSTFTLLKINANSNARTPGIAIDEIRIGTSWEDVVSTTNEPLDIVDNEIANFKIYPNPANDYIEIESGAESVTSITVFDILGEQVLIQEVLNDNRMDISSLTKGVYFIKIRGDNNSSITKKIIKN